MNRALSNKNIIDQFLELIKSNSKREHVQFIVDKILPEAKTNEKSSLSVELKFRIDLTITFLKTQLNIGPFLDQLNSLGKFCIEHGELELAGDLLSKVITKHKKYKQYNHQAARAYFSLAEIDVIQANWVEANKLLRKSRALFSSRNDNLGLSEIENFLGTIYGEKGETISSKRHFESALLLLKNKRAGLLKSKIEMNLGIVHVILRNFDIALQLLNSALENFMQHNENKLIAEANHNIGMVYLRLNAFDKALGKFENSLNISVREGYYPIVGIAYLGAAETYLNLGELEKADMYSTLGLASCLVINDRLTAADLYKIKGMIEAARNNFDKAEAFLLTGLRINDELKNEMNYTETAFELADLYSKNSRNADAKKYYEASLKYYRKMNLNKEIQNIIARLESL